MHAWRLHLIWPGNILCTNSNTQVLSSSWRQNDTIKPCGCSGHFGCSFWAWAKKKEVKALKDKTPSFFAPIKSMDGLNSILYYTLCRNVLSHTLRSGQIRCMCTYCTWWNLGDPNPWSFTWQMILLYYYYYHIKLCCAYTELLFCIHAILSDQSRVPLLFFPAICKTTAQSTSCTFIMTCRQTTFLDEPLTKAHVNMLTAVQFQWACSL